MGQCCEVRTDIPERQRRILHVVLWITMRSAWVCSLNDVAGNGAVLLASAGVAWTGSAWPDVGVGLLIAGLFSISGVAVFRAASRGGGSPAGGGARKTANVA